MGELRRLRGRPTETEPAGRSSSGATVSWKVHVALDFLATFFSPFCVYRELGGLSWQCPDFHSEHTVSLRRRLSQYWFFCHHCGWAVVYFAVDAQQLRRATRSAVSRRERLEPTANLGADERSRPSRRLADDPQQQR